MVGDVTSVIVATQNRRGQFLRLVESLEQTQPHPHELVVVDDASEIPLQPTLESRTLPFRVKVLRNPAPTGPGAARNRGVHASRGAILLFTDDDCVVEPAWVGTLAGRLQASSTSRLGGVGGRVLALGADLLSRYYEFHRVLEPRPHDRTHPERIPYLVTANCAIRRDVFMLAGGFDGRLPVAGGEDAALSMRIARRGYYMEHVAEAVVRHQFRSGLWDFMRTFYRYGLGGRYVVDRYLPLQR